MLCDYRAMYAWFLGCDFHGRVNSHDFSSLSTEPRAFPSVSQEFCRVNVPRHTLYTLYNMEDTFYEYLQDALWLPGTYLVQLVQMGT